MVVKKAQCYCSANRYSSKSCAVFIMGHVQAKLFICLTKGEIFCLFLLLGFLSLSHPLNSFKVVVFAKILATLSTH